MRDPIEALLRPSSIALIGASAKPGKIGNALVMNLSKSKARLHLIHPSEERIEGIPCRRSILDVDDDIDLAIIALKAENAVPELRKAVDKKVPCVIIVSAGFSETGDEGRELEEQMVSYAGPKGTRILGPNTLGVCSPASGIDTLLIPSERSPRPKKGGLAIISQSGSVQVSSLEKASAMNIGISYSIGLGNRCDISEIDILRNLKDDAATKCIALYLESFRDGGELMSLARDVCKEKPIIAIKAGRTSEGARAASSHTGAIARGTDSVVNGAFRQSGIIRAYDDEELLDIANAFALMPAAKGKRVAYVGSAGGIGVMASDHVSGAGLSMSSFEETTKERLRGVLESFAPINNPVDLTASSNPKQYDESVRIVVSDRNVDMVILSIDMQPPMMTDSVFDLIPGWVGLAKPIIGTSTGGALAERTVRRMQELGIPSYASLTRCVRAVRALYERGMFVKKCDSIEG